MTERTANALRLTAVDGEAAKLGLFPGMALTDARARVERLDVAAAAPEHDTALLKRLAQWCERYTPLVAFDEPHGLMLDITGCAHLFGGPAAMRADALCRFERAGLHVQAAIADNSFAARLLARGTKGGV
ncbi:Y-family DNA polymerase, partial [Brucella abortus]